MGEYHHIGMEQYNADEDTGTWFPRPDYMREEEPAEEPAKELAEEPAEEAAEEADA